MQHTNIQQQFTWSTPIHSSSSHAAHQYTAAVHMQHTNTHFWSYLAQFFLESEIFQTKFAEKIKTHFVFRNFLSKIVSFLDNVDKHGRAKEAKDESIGGGADKSLARPGRKHATATKLGFYSTYSPRSSIHFSAHCSNICKPLKENSKVVRPTRSPRQQWPPRRTKNGDLSIVFFSPGNRW